MHLHFLLFAFKTTLFKIRSMALAEASQVDFTSLFIHGDSEERYGVTHVSEITA